MKKLLLLLTWFALTSCEASLCQDCYTIYRSDGTSEWVCIEYRCDEYYERF